MTEFNIRRRLAEDGQSPEEIEELLSELANQYNDDDRDRRAEEIHHSSLT